MHPPFVVALFAAFLAAGAGLLLPHPEPEAAPPRLKHESPRLARCFAPGTPLEIARLLEADGGPAPRFEIGSWWTSTATDGSTGQGDAITLRWSIVPDGTLIVGNGTDLPTSNSNLRAWLDSRYGSINTWLPLFEQSFARWGELTGVTYVYEPNDDGQNLQSNGSAGAIGVRGDVRIAAHTIDGFGGTLAYNYFPSNGGDMVLDSGDGFFNSTSNNSRRLRNVIMHEHGHGLGLAHSCPANSTKLMEPFIAENFDGPQRDDILGGQRNNGDPDEDNNSVGAATPLGTLGASTTVRRNLSIDDNSDMDFFSFSVPSANSYTVAVTLTPVGATYLAGAQNFDGSCSAGSNYDSLRVHNLGLELRTSVTPLASSNSGAEGVSETIPSYQLGGAGPYYIRVFGDASNDVQAYELSVTIEESVAGIFALSNTAESVAETAGNIVLTVERTNDTSAVESVNYATAGGDATAGFDYTAVSGTLQFGAGQISATVGVPVLNNTEFRGDRTFNLSLSNPTGNAVLGSPASTAITILEDDAPGIFVFENNDLSTVGTIPGADDATPLASTVYPMTIEVTGVTGEVIDLSVDLDELTHEFPRDMDILLEGPTGQTVMLLSDAGGDNSDALSDATLSFDDSGTVVTNRDTGLVPGATYSPLNLDPLDDVLLAPAPASPFATDLSSFAGLPPNGTWSLYFMDDWASLDEGSLGGFTLEFTTSQTAPFPVDIRISSINFDGTTVAMEVISTGTATFSLQRSDKLSGWTTIEPGLTPGTNPWVVTDDPPASGDRWYYRLIEE